MPAVSRPSTRRRVCVGACVGACGSGGGRLQYTKYEAAVTGLLLGGAGALVSVDLTGHEFDLKVFHPLCPHPSRAPPPLDPLSA